MDRGYLDFERLAHLDDAGSFFVTRKSTSRLAVAIHAGRSFDRPHLRPDGSRTGFIRARASTVRCGGSSSTSQTGKRLVFLTNNFASTHSPSPSYKYRWQVELFFKWIKQHLRIKAFFGTRRMVCIRSITSRLSFG